MIDKNTVGIITKPHIYYNTWIKHWVCISEDGPWDLCISSPRSYRIGAGKSVVEAYRDWANKCSMVVVETPKHWSGSRQDGGKWRLT